ncbi:hypothetical protein LIER_14436 [Lithospermum erythrorhizon]|uniref:Dirigent protein n=1 Tax=Lithospermum erythrorhizon TaxID=34254 RepID=A0AAV3Q3S5_LITER
MSDHRYSKSFLNIICNKENSPSSHMAKSSRLQLKHILSVLILALAFTCALSDDVLSNAPTVLPNPISGAIPGPRVTSPGPGVNYPESPVSGEIPGAIPGPRVTSPELGDTIESPISGAIPGPRVTSPESPVSGVIPGPGVNYPESPVSGEIPGPGITFPESSVSGPIPGSGVSSPESTVSGKIPAPGVSSPDSPASGAIPGSGVSSHDSLASGAIPGPGVSSPDSPVSGAIPGPTVKPAPDAKSSSAPVETPEHTFTFFMHDILGGSQPTAVAVTGVVANPAVSGQVAFAKPNGAVLSVNTGVETNNGNSAILNNNNVPFLSGLSGFSNTGVQNNGNSIIGGNFGFPAINLAQFPTGTTLQNLMFGTLTVFDDELTEGHELGSGLIGKAQGFYVASSQNGISQTMIFNVMFREGGYADTLCFFGVHRTGKSESHLAIMGGTGKYVNAKGFATVKTFPADPNHQETDGMETVLEIIVYVA